MARSRSLREDMRRPKAQYGPQNSALTDVGTGESAPLKPSLIGGIIKTGVKAYIGGAVGAAMPAQSGPAGATVTPAPKAPAAMDEGIVSRPTVEGISSSKPTAKDTFGGAGEWLKRRHEAGVSAFKRSFR